MWTWFSVDLECSQKGVSCGFMKHEFCSKTNKCLYVLFSVYNCKLWPTSLLLHFQDASTIDDDFIYELFESQLKQSPRLSTVPSLLSANKLLELVCDAFLALIHFVFIGLYYKLFSYQWYKICHHTFECRFSTHPILLLGGFLYQLHLIRLTSIWLITVRYLWWESVRCPDWWVTFRSKNVQQTPLYRIKIMNRKIWIHLPMWTIRRYFLAFVSTFTKHISLQL